MPTCAPFSGQLQIFEGTDYRYRPEQFLNGIKARTIYQLGPETTSPDQKHKWHVRRKALVTKCLDVSASGCFNSLPEADKQYWSTFTIQFLKQFDIVTAQYKLKLKLKTHN